MDCTALRIYWADFKFSEADLVPPSKRVKFSPGYIDLTSQSDTDEVEVIRTPEEMESEQLVAPFAQGTN